MIEKRMKKVRKGEKSGGQTTRGANNGLQTGEQSECGAVRRGGTVRDRRRGKGSRRMIRGCQRRIYYVRNPESEIFDEAYFVIKRNYRGRGTSLDGGEELGGEAKRISSLLDSGRSGGCRSAPGGRLLAFAAGAAAATAAAVVLAVVLNVFS